MSSSGVSTDLPPALRRIMATAADLVAAVDRFRSGAGAGAGAGDQEWADYVALRVGQDSQRLSRATADGDADRFVDAVLRFSSDVKPLRESSPAMQPLADDVIGRSRELAQLYIDVLMPMVTAAGRLSDSAAAEVGVALRAIAVEGPVRG